MTNSEQLCSQSKSGIKSPLGTLMFGLLYPAVLGTFFYSLLPEALAIARRPWEVSALPLAKLVVSFLLVLHFILDFYFTLQVALQTSDYPGKAFLLDLLVVLALFVAYDAIHLDSIEIQPDVRWAAGAMGFSYALFQIWGHWMKSAVGENWLLRIYEAGAAVAFFLIAVFRPRISLLALALLASALCMLLIARPIVLRFRRQL